MYSKILYRLKDLTLVLLTHYLKPLHSRFL